MERKASFTLQEIMDRLAEILALKQTGTFYIATDRNTSCRFAVEYGKLTYCSHSRERGMRAVQSLLETGGGSCSFSENQVLPFRQDDRIDHQASLILLNLHPTPPVKIVQPPPSTEKLPAVTPPQKSAPSRYYRGYVPER